MSFAAHLARDPSLGNRLHACQAPNEIVKLASSIGYSFTPKELRDLSANLAAPYWPWAGKGRQWRHSFFET